jgi:hypothetical protein
MHRLTADEEKLREEQAQVQTAAQTRAELMLCHRCGQLTKSPALIRFWVSTSGSRKGLVATFFCTARGFFLDPKH